MDINIQDDECWVCGKTKQLTSHHVIPKHLKPIKNIQVVICKKCHANINNADIRGIYAYVYKVDKQVESLVNSINRLKSMIEFNLEKEKSKEEVNKG